jgi:hypothetical protein
VKHISAIIVLLYLLSAILILTLASIAKYISAFGTAGVLAANDPIFQIQNRILLMLVATIEIGTILIMVLCKKRWLSCLCGGVLGTQFLLYRVFFVFGHYSRGCPCLGTLGDWIPVSENTLNVILWTAASWLSVGGYGAFLLAWINDKKANISLEHYQRPI